MGCGNFAGFGPEGGGLAWPQPRINCRSTSLGPAHPPPVRPGAAPPALANTHRALENAGERGWLDSGAHGGHRRRGGRAVGGLTPNLTPRLPTTSTIDP